MEHFMPVRNLEEMFEVLKSKPKKKMIAVYAIDHHTINAVSNAIDLGLVEGILVGTKSEIEKVCKAEDIDVNKFKIIDESDDVKAAAKSVEMINNGEADFIM